MKIYLPKYTSHAGRWIYDGYLDAWKQLGYGIVVPTEEETTATTVRQTHGQCAQFLRIPINEERLNEDYIIMATDDLAHDYGPRFLKAASKDSDPDLNGFIPLATSSTMLPIVFLPCVPGL